MQVILLVPSLSTFPSIGSLRQATLAQIEERFAPALDSKLLQPLGFGNHSRQRVFCLSRTFWCWIWQVLQTNTSCREVVRQVQALLALHSSKPLDGRTGAYCQARSKLPLSLLRKLFGQSFLSAEQACAPSTLLRGRPIRVVDGSGVRLPDSPSNQKSFPSPTSQYGKACSPYMKIVALFSLTSGAILGSITGNLQSSECRLFVALRSLLRPKDIVLADRAYGSFAILALLSSMQVDVIARLSASRKVDYRKASKRFDRHDGLFVWKKPSYSKGCIIDQSQWKQLPEELTVRILRLQVQRKGFRTRLLTVVTTLIDPEAYPSSDILAAYGKRWRMEMCLDDLKTTLGMKELSCQTPEMVQKELLMFLTAHNLLRWIMAQAVQSAGAKLEQISFKGTLDGFRQWSQAMAIAGYCQDQVTIARLWEEFLKALAADLVPRRPGRREPRAVKSPRSKYPRLNKSRAQYVERLSRNGRRIRARLRKKAILV